MTKMYACFARSAFSVTGMGLTETKNNWIVFPANNGLKVGPCSTLMLVGSMRAGAAAASDAGWTCTGSLMHEIRAQNSVNFLQFD